MLPDFDVQFWRLPAHSDLLNTESVAAGWAWEPLWAEDPDESFPVVQHLLSLDLGARRTFGPLVLTADVPLRAVWSGEVGIANPRLSVATRGTSGLTASFIVPYDTLSSPISEPGLAVSTSIFTRLEFADAVTMDVEAGADYRKASDYGSGAHARGDLHVGRYGLGIVAFYTLGKQSALISESRLYAHWEKNWLHVQPELGVGLTDTPGTVRLRGVVTFSRLPPTPAAPSAPIEVAVTPAAPAPAPVPAPEPQPAPAPEPEPPAPPAPPVMETWAVIEVHPPCGVDTSAWSAPRAAAARTMLLGKGLEDSHIETSIKDCEVKPFMQVKLDSRPAPSE